jgi:hypothetical protein
VQTLQKESEVAEGSNSSIFAIFASTQYLETTYCQNVTVGPGYDSDESF